MSGGSLDYVSYKLESAMERIGESKRPLHRAFAAHLQLVMDALHEIEWEFSGDTGTGAADESIRKLLAPGADLAAAVADAKEVAKILHDTIVQAEKPLAE